MAYAMGTQGAKLVLVARSGTLERTVREFAAENIEAKAVAADLGDAARRTQAIGEINAAFGAPDILVNAAANNIRKPLPELSEDEIRATLALNLEAPLALIRALAPAMQARGWGASSTSPRSSHSAPSTIAASTAFRRAASSR
jgi:gluconate 5-dehydrogenase